MNVKTLIAQLLTMPMDAEVTLDTDDGLEGNYMPVLGASQKLTLMGEFVVLDADISRIGIKK